MAEERTLGLARALEREDEELSKDELQRRMEEARESISSTVTEIKENVAQQVETVKDALDWREHFKKQPVAWSLGAAGIGFLTGYCIAATVKGNPEHEDNRVSVTNTYARPLLGQPQYAEAPDIALRENGNNDEGPGLLGRFKETSAYERLSKEVGSLGDRLIDDLSTTAQMVVLPALLGKLKSWIGLDLSAGRRLESSDKVQPARNPDRSERNTYQPVLERPS